MDKDLWPHQDPFSRRGSAIYTITDIQANTIEVSISLGEQYGEGISAFMTYKIHTKTSLRHFKSEDFTVTRRYKDFLWLHERLSEHYKASLIPSLPEKSVTTERFQADFLEFRRRELERFIKRILNHVILNKSTDLVTFLEARDRELIEVKTSAVGKTNLATQMMGLFGTKITNNLLVPPETDFWFSEKKTFLVSLEQVLTALANTANGIAIRYQQLASIYQFVSEATENLANQKTAAFSENFKANYSNLSFTYGELGPLNLDLSKGIKTNFEDEIRDYVRMIGSIKTLLEYRTDRNASLHELSNNLKSKTEKIDKLRGNGSAVPLALQQDVQRLEKQLESDKEKFDQLSRACKEDIIQFELQKAKEIKQAILALVQNNMEHELMVSDLWKKLFAKMTLK